MQLTPEQARAVEHRGSNLLVAASAGSGKTEVLARRCVSLLADAAHPCGVDELLVVTFTRAAAAELRVRIGRMLRETAAKMPRSKLAGHLRRQEALLDTADIGTIDAWCGRIIREFAVEAGVDPAFTMLSDQDAALRRQHELDRLLGEIHGGGDELCAAAQRWIARAPVPDDRFLRELIRHLHRFRENLINPVQQLPQLLAAPASPAGFLANALQEELAFQAAQLDGLAAADELPAVLVEYRTRLDAWTAALADADAETLGQTLGDIEGYRIAKPKRGTSEPPLVAEVRSRWLEKRLQKRWPPADVAAMLAQHPQTAEFIAILRQLEERFDERLRAAHHAAATYEFADVQRIALDLLGMPAGATRTPTLIAQRLQQRYAHILVDEYQDTSPVQVALLELVTRTTAGGTNRFMVGDVKQSIYGFRQAEPRLFSRLLATYDAGAAEGAVVFLAANFRSHARLLNALDGLFAQLFDHRLGGTAYDQRERLQTGRAAGEPPNATLDATSRVRVYVLEAENRRGASSSTDEEEEDPLGPERIEREAQVAADEIRRLLDADVQLPERDADGNVTWRPLELRDIAILLRSAHENAGRIATILRRAGLPCATGGRETLLGASEVADVRAVLTLLTNRRQDLALAAYLRGPLMPRACGPLTVPQLQAIRDAAHPRCDLLDALDQVRTTAVDANLAAHIDAALAQLDHWAALARETDVPGLLQQLFADTSLIGFARGLPGGAQRVAVLRSLQHFAQQFDAASAGGLAEFVAYLDELLAADIEAEAGAVGDANVVRIMTIHGSKGLEFPVVFLLAAGHAFNRTGQNERLQCDPDVGVGLSCADYPTRGELVSLRYPLARVRRAQRELEEELRLLYVALTRAREQLMIIGHAKPGVWDELLADPSAAREIPLITRLAVAHRLEWVLRATAAGGLHLPHGDTPALLSVHTCAADDVVVNLRTPPAPPAGTVTLTPADEAWLTASRSLLATPIDTTLARVPAVCSVSALKAAVWEQRAQEADTPPALDTRHVQLRVPAFLADAAQPDARVLGTATHRFLEHADLAVATTEADVGAELTRLRAAGLLTDIEAELVPPAVVAWFAKSVEGRALAAAGNRAYRELAFVQAAPLPHAPQEFTLVRGIIDVVLPTTAGLVLLDYKTDMTHTAADFDARVAGYTTQLHAYAAAATALFGQPVVRAVLVFLRMQRIVDVPLPAGPDDSPAA